MGTTALLCGTEGHVTAGMFQSHFEVRVLHFFFLSCNFAVHFIVPVSGGMSSICLILLFLRDTHKLNLQYRLIVIIQ